MPMDARSSVGNLAVSHDGKWVVSGTTSGQVAVWDAESHSKVSEFKAYSGWVRVVDVSPDATRIATGSKDRTVCVWLLSTDQRLLGPCTTTAPWACVTIYGEGDRAVGRILEHILTGSGDVAWTGSAGGYNSCLPTDLTVYNPLRVVPLHIPALIETAEMDSMVATLRSSLPDLSLAVLLHNRLNELPLPSLSASRLRLPGIVFRLTEFDHTSEPDPVTNLRVYHETFWGIEIKTADDLTRTTDLCLVHPWMRPLPDEEFLEGAACA